MDREEVFYLVPYVLSLCITLSVFFYTWRHRSIRGARTYSWFVGGQSIAVIGFLFELVSPNIATKIMWDKFQWLAEFYLIILPFLFFVVEFTDQKINRPRLIIGGLASILLSFTILLLTDDLHHLFYPDPQLTSDSPFPNLIYTFTPLIYLYSLVYIYGINLFGLGLIIRRALEPHNAQRFQYWTIAFGFLIPLLSTVFSLLNIRIAPQRDITPFSFAIGNLVIVWGLFRYGLFSLVHIARETILENLGDAILVLNSENRILDANRAALVTSQRNLKQIVGRPILEIALSERRPIFEKVLQVFEGKLEVTFPVGNEPVIYEVNVFPLRDSKGLLLGRVFVWHDITHRKMLEIRYKELSEKLEIRVAERTRQLYESTERFRALFEQTHDAIFILDLSGKHLQTNQRAADMLGYTPEELLQLSLHDTSAEVEESISMLSRIKNGEDIPLYERRFRKKDGTILYAEVNVELVRDLSGNPLHIQSLVRDITERKLADQALRHSAEQYRTVVENQTEFIVRWRPDGIRTFVNEAYCRYFGISSEDALLSGFMDLVAEEDRPAVEEKMHRLISGKTTTETEIHRVILPDGSIGWHEWIDHAIRDDQGKLLEFQSVGRDITQKVITEKSLLREFTFNEVFMRMLARFAACNYNEVDVTIRTALDETAAFLGGDFADILLLSSNRTSWVSVNNWTEVMEKSNRQPLHSIEVGELVWSERKVRNGEIVKINTLEDFPPEAEKDRNLAAEQGVRSMLTIPIRGKNASIFGAVDVVSYERQITWKDSDIIHLKLIGDAIATLLERKLAEEGLAEAYDTTLEGWAKALELRDKETEGHSRRVTKTTIAVARAMNIPEDEVEHIRRGSILHDIGKMGIPDDILRKNGPLTDEERNVVKKHPVTAYELLRPISYLEKAINIPYCHHEKWDGSGYPHGLKGEEIPLAARIFAVVDVWDALSHDRPYNKAWTQEKIVQYFLEQSGKHFDPQVVIVFLTMVEKGEI